MAWTWHRRLGVVGLVLAVLVLAAVVFAVILPQLANATHTVGGMKVGQQRCTDTMSSDADTTEECGRLTSFASQLVDQTAHASVASVAVYREPPPTSRMLSTYSGYADFAIVSFKLSDDTEQAFYVRCGVGIAKELCFDLRPVKPGETVDQQVSNPNPVAVP